MKVLGWRLYFLFCFGVHLRIPEKLQEFWDENQNLWKFLNWGSPFFLVLTEEFVKIRKNFETKTRICGNFWIQDLSFFLVFTKEIGKIASTIIRICGLHLVRLIHTRINCVPCPSRIHINKLLVPPKFIFALPPSHAILAPGLTQNKYKNNWRA